MVRYHGDYIIPGSLYLELCSLHFTFTLGGLKKLVRQSRDVVTKGYDISGFDISEGCYKKTITSQCPNLFLTNGSYSVFYLDKGSRIWVIM